MMTFTDGKFILELSHKREGDRMCWVPHWPASGAPRHESSTSLSGKRLQIILINSRSLEQLSLRYMLFVACMFSCCLTLVFFCTVSDDNSSVQSSPWQRDHCWKQNTPRKGRSVNMQFTMRPLGTVRHLRRLSTYWRVISRKRRCPYDKSELPVLKIKSEDGEVKSSEVSKQFRKSARLGKLPSIVQTLWDKMPVVKAVVHTGRIDPSIISPRKRILREMERVTLEEGANSKRQKARTAQGNGNVTCNNTTVTCQTLHPAGLPQAAKSTASSYSITSLLGPSRDRDRDRDDEALTASKETEPSFLRTLLKSPSQSSSGEHTPELISKSRCNSKSGNSRKSSPMQQHLPASPTLSPSPGLRSPVTQPMVGGAPQYSPFMQFPLSYSPYMSYYAGLPISPAPYRGSHPPGPPPLWMFPVSSLPRGALYPGLPTYHAHAPLSPSPWVQLNHQPHLDDLKKDDGSSGKLSAILFCYHYLFLKCLIFQEIWNYLSIFIVS